MMSHEIMGSSGLAKHHTLSGLIQLLCAISIVGIPNGRARVILWVLIKSIRESMRWAGLNNLQFLFSSHKGWCLLKLPNQNIWSVGDGSAVARFVLR